MPTADRTPPIQYLTAFVAAARLNSFKQAAELLNVSPSAVSQQIKTLEQHIGLSLFNRHQRALRLTLAGKNFYQFASRSVDQYESGYTQFKAQFLSPSLKISMIPYIANELVIPKLYQFQDAHPNLDLVIETSMRLEDLEASGLDAAIRFGTPPWKGYDATLITRAQSALIAAPSYFKNNPIKTSADWQKQTLIHVRQDINDWQRFMDHNNMQFQPKKSLYFDSYAAAIRATEEGLGIAIGVFPITADKVLSEKLSTLSHKYTPLEEAFYFVTKPNFSKQAYYQALLTWLQSIFVLSE